MFRGKNMAVYFKELRFYVHIGVIVYGTMFSPAVTRADGDAEGLPQDLTEIGIQRLLDFDLVVTSPGKKEQALSKTASAIHVLSHEDIKRSGAKHIADALRLVPGVNVAKVSSSQWAVSIRGFNQVYANKLLVLVDGVSVFSPLTNGVFWSTLDLPLDDVERIEVIRGPGASLWGANAVNGVINVITKHASTTQGQKVSLAEGTDGQGSAEARFGEALSKDTYLRMSGKGTHATEDNFINDSGASDDWNIGTVEGRIDSDLGHGDEIKFITRAYSETDDVRTQTPVLTPPFIDSSSYSSIAHWNGGHAAVNFTSTLEDSSKLNVIGSISHQDRESELISLRYTAYELDVTHQLRPFESHEVVYGGSYRLFDNSVDGTYAQDLMPRHRTMQRGNWFLQDEIALVKNELHFIAGSKFEVNDSTGFEIMPNTRLIWNPNNKDSVWVGWSRAVAPPSIVFEDVRFPVAAIPGDGTAPGTLVEIFGDRSVGSEILYSYESGYRSNVTDNVSFELTLFYNEYDNILTQEPDTPYVDTPLGSSDPAVIVPLRFGNGITATEIGGESSLEYRPLSWVSVIGGYAYLSARGSQGNSLDTGNIRIAEGSAPRHTVSLRTSIDPYESVKFDVMLRYVDSLELGNIPDYYEMDARIGWQVAKGLELGIVGHNLLHNAHQEFIGNLFGPPPLEIQRTILGTLSYQF